MTPTLVRRCLFVAMLLSSAGVPSAQSGLFGEYFDASSPPPIGSPADFERVDPLIDFAWPLDAPTGTTILPDDSYSTRWTGWVRIPSGGAWTFTLTSNDGARLWVDGDLVVSDWSVHATRDASGTTALQGGWHALRLEHFNQGGTAVIRLSYEGPGQPRVVVPTVDLCSSSLCTGGLGLTVDAGPDRFFAPPETSITLRARIRGMKFSELPPGHIVSWTQLAGPQATIGNGERLDPTITPTRPGILRFRVKVLDGQSGFDTDEVSVLALGETLDAVLTGELRKWHKVALTFEHSAMLSEGGTPNPFLDLRLTTYFFHPLSETLYTVPGFFAADGNAAESSASAGKKWRTNFTPDRAGAWFYLATFRSGANVALDPDPEAGQSAGFDGASGSFTVAPADPFADGFLAQGRLEYVGGHHLRCAETGEYFLKSGTNSPENFLGYYEFDNTTDLGGAANDLDAAQAGLHRYDPHLDDYVDRGVPTWKNGKGRRIYGALDYLASRGVNSLYALTFNTDGGDGREVWPWVSVADRRRFDVSKLAQWELVVDHMMRAGIAWHLVTQETENDQVLDLGALGTERQLYYRELVARFGHAPALIWNLGEENSNTPEERKAFADFLRAIDPYDHPIALHNVNADLEGSYGDLFGTHLELVSLQSDLGISAPDTQDLLAESADSDRPWVVNYDEQGPANDGAVPDAEDPGHDALRELGLWPNLMAGGGGCEWYFGYAHPHNDLDCEDFRSRDTLWRQTTRAVDFLREHLPFHEMSSADALAGLAGTRTLAKSGEFYAVYLPSGGTTTLDLETYSGTFLVSWFDAKNGGAPQTGSVAQITGPGVRSLGAPPNQPGANDWLAFVRRAANFVPVVASVSIEPEPFEGGNFAVLARAGDPNGPDDSLAVTVSVFTPQGEFFDTFPLFHRGGDLYSLFFPSLPPLSSGTWWLVVEAEDEAGAIDSLLGSFVVP